MWEKCDTLNDISSVRMAHNFVVVFAKETQR